MSLTDTADLLAAFEAAQEADRVSVKTRHDRQRYLLSFARHLGSRALLDATPRDVDRWLATRNLAPNRRSLYAGALSAFYRWAEGESLVRHDPAAAHLVRHRLDFGDFWEVTRGYRRAQERRGLALNTQKNAKYVLWRLYDFLQPKALLDATTADVEAFLDSRGLSAPSRRGYVSRLHGFYSWAVEEGLLEVAPTARIIRPLLPRYVPRPIADDDLARAIAVATPRLRAWFLLAAYQGLRCQEIAGIHREDLLDEVTPPVLIVRAGKGKRERILPLHPDVWAALVAHGLPRSGQVFSDTRMGVARRPIKAHTVSHHGNSFLHELGITSTMHQLRHWHGTRLYSSTLDLRMVQEILGHSSPTTTARYVAFNPGDAVAAVTSLSVRP